MKKTDTLLWKWLINTHPKAINVTWELYSNNFECTKFIKFKESSVDWDKMNPLFSTTKAGFQGTFENSSSEEVMVGELILKSGKKYPVGVKISVKDCFGEVLDYLIQNSEAED